MKYLPLVLLFIFQLSSCSKNKGKEIIDIKYSAYTWHLGKDSAEFYFAYYLNINKNNQYTLMKKDSFISEPKYFTDYITDTLQNLIDTIFENKNYSKTYLFDSSDLKMYDGFYYFLDITQKDGQRKIIQFVPNKSPEQIKKLSSKLDSLIYSASKKTAEFNIKNYQSELEALAKAEGLKTPKLRQLPPVIIEKK